MAKMKITEDKLNQILSESIINILNEESIEEIMGWQKGAGIGNNLVNMANWAGQKRQDLRQLGNNMRSAYYTGVGQSRMNHMTDNMGRRFAGDNAAEALRYGNMNGDEYGKLRRAEVIKQNNNSNNIQPQQPQPNQPNNKYDVNSYLSPQQISHADETTVLRYLVGKGFNWDKNTQRWLYSDGKSYADVSGYADIRAAAQRYKALMTARLSEIKKYNNMAKMKITESELNRIISESIKNVLNEAKADEGILNWKSKGIDDMKMKQALKLYTNYRNLADEANAYLAKVQKKGSNAFGTNYRGGIGAAKEFAQNGYRTPQPQPAAETMKEGFFRGAQSVANKVADNIKTKPIGSAFSGTKDAYNMGDAAGDSNQYARMRDNVNAALTKFKTYCAENGVNMQQVVTAFDTNARQGLVGGKDTSKRTERRGTQNSSVGGFKSTAGNSKKMPGAGPASFAGKKKEIDDTSKDVNKSAFHGLGEDKDKETSKKGASKKESKDTSKKKGGKK